MIIQKGEANHLENNPLDSVEHNGSKKIQIEDMNVLIEEIEVVDGEDAPMKEKPKDVQDMQNSQFEDQAKMVENFDVENIRAPESQGLVAPIYMEGSVNIPNIPIASEILIGDVHLENHDTIAGNPNDLKNTEMNVREMEEGEIQICSKS